MKVGFTRARATLIILGSAQALAEGSKDWAELVEDATSRGCLLTVNSVDRCLLSDEQSSEADKKEQKLKQQQQQQPQPQPQPQHQQELQLQQQQKQPQQPQQQPL